MAKLDTLTLRVIDPRAQRKFYCDVLGMSDQGDGRVGFSQNEIAIKFVKATGPYTPQPSDNYWKIALSVPNIEFACDQLQSAGVTCTDPKQFRDIGYLAHVTDPEGFTVELIEHWFKGDRPDGSHDTSQLGGGPCLNLVTLRTADISLIEPEILSWGMTPLSVQTVEPYGFTLYFYAFTNEYLPNPDLKAIENRPWVYQRPYSVLEIQHVHDLSAVTFSAQESCGYGGLTISSAKAETYCPRLGVTGKK
jgi:catechol 2,3-dioxygenase-like lactoylglutathione lyase family enzyme